MAVNPCAKRVTPQTAYEVWQTYDGSFTYFVLKKYQSPEKEAENPQARWYCFTTSPYVPDGEYGDAYAAEVKNGTHKLDYNPLTHQDDQTTGKEQEVMELLTDELRQQLPPLYSQEHVDDPLCIVKFFTPDSNWTWYAYEFDGEDLFFGWVVGFEMELGYFSLTELQEARGPLGLPIERDLYFTPIPFSKVKKLHQGSASQPITLNIIIVDDLPSYDTETEANPDVAEDQGREGKAHDE